MEATLASRRMRVDGRHMTAVFAGGALGTLLRVALVETVAHDPGRWPWATLIANVTAAGLLGFVATHLPPSSVRRPLLATGLCGGLSTFSTLQLELLQMLDASHVGLALLYAAVSIAVGLAAVAVGSGMARAPEVDP